MHPSANTAGGSRVTRWTRETIIAKIIEWNERYGEPPCSADWNPSLARWRAQEWRAERYREGDWPSTNAAKRPFGGSFDAAVRAAGLEPHRPGPKRAGAAPARRPVEPREDLAEALDRAHAAEERVVELERRLLFAEGRAERAEANVGEPRRRVHRAGTKRRDRDRVRVVRRDPRTDVLERAQVLVADAEARVRAAEDQAEAAALDAAEARRESAKAKRRARELSALIAEDQRRLTGCELAELRSGEPSGPAVLAAAIKRLARARAAGDRGGLASALAEVASAAVRWRDRI